MKKIACFLPFISLSHAFSLAVSFIFRLLKTHDFCNLPSTLHHFYTLSFGFLIMCRGNFKHHHQHIHTIYNAIKETRSRSAGSTQKCVQNERKPQIHRIKSKPKKGSSGFHKIIYDFLKSRRCIGLFYPFKPLIM